MTRYKQAAPRINWEAFTLNSSEADAIGDFIQGGSVKKLEKAIYDENTKAEFVKVKKLGLSDDDLRNKFKTSLRSWYSF